MIQTWLPLPDFRQSVRSLSDAHLFMQRQHVLYMLEVFHDVELATSEVAGSLRANEPLNPHAPVMRMWQGHEVQLAEYGLEACEEYAVRQGSEDELYSKIAFHLDCALGEDSDMTKPGWFGEVDFHISHQSALMRLDKLFYKEHFKVANLGDPLVWPVSDHAKKA